MKFDGFGMTISSSVVVEDEAVALERKALHDLLLGATQENACSISFSGWGFDVLGGVQL